MQYFRITFLIISLCLFLAGCARFPSSITNNAPTRTILSRISVAGSINPNYYYFLALGVDQTGATGPVPVVTGPGYTNGWGTITGLPAGQVEQPPFYVQYHNGSFQQYLNGQPIGVPFTASISADGTNGDVSNTITIEIDQQVLTGLLGSTLAPIVQLNWITMDEIDIPPQSDITTKEYDGFGVAGNDYLSEVPLTVANTMQSGVNGIPEEPTYNQGERTTANNDLDIREWQVDVRIRSITTP